MKLIQFCSAAAATFMLATASLNAQNDVPCLSKGNFAIGSRIGFSASNSDIKIESNGSTVESGTSKNTQVNLTPSIGYFFADNFVVGAAMDWNLITSKDRNSSNKTSDSKVLFGPWVRMYLPVADDQAFFIGATSGFGQSNTTLNVGGTDQTVNTKISTFGIGPGYSIFANNCVSLEAQAKYNYGISKNSVTVNGVNQDTRSNTNSFDFVVGVHYYFTRARG